MTAPADVVEVVITGPRDFVAPFTRSLVEDRLIACAHVSNIDATYRWEGRVEQAEEARAAMHTLRADVAVVSERIRREHPYDVPCILVLPIESADADYLRWVAEAVHSQR